MHSSRDGRAGAGRAAVAAAALLLLAACGAGPPPEPPEPAEQAGPPAAVGVTGEVMQYRAGIARRIITVRVRTEAPLDVRGLVLRPAGFEVGDRAPADAQLGAGNSVDLRTGYGAARCDVAPDGPTDALLEVVQDGTPRQVRLDLEDPYDLVRSLHSYECTERALRSQVEIAFVAGWAPDPGGAALRGTLRLRRLAGSAEVLVPELEGTTLLGITGGPPGGPVAVLPPGSAEVSVPVQVTATRCDEHALIESKRPTAFGALVALDGGTLVRLVVEPEPAERGQLTRFASDRCAARPPG